MGDVLIRFVDVHKAFGTKHVYRGLDVELRRGVDHQGVYCVLTWPRRASRKEFEEGSPAERDRDLVLVGRWCDLTGTFL